MSRCNLATGWTSVERTIPLKVGGISALETLILSFGIVSSICSAVGVVRLTRWPRNRNGGNYDSNSLWFFYSLSKVGSSDILDMTFNFMMNQYVPFVNFVGFLQQCHGLLT
jgi:hypothetical protein